MRHEVKVHKQFEKEIIKAQGHKAQGHKGARHKGARDKGVLILREIVSKTLTANCIKEKLR
jgi:hypothetical protein